jgi:hypothetical protein
VVSTGTVPESFCWRVAGMPTIVSTALHAKPWLANSANLLSKLAVWNPALCENFHNCELIPGYFRAEPLCCIGNPDSGNPSLDEALTGGIGPNCGASQASLEPTAVI